MLKTLIALSLTAAFAGTPGQPPRSVIFLDICSTRADHMGLYGYKRPTTPNIDALAREGVVFENAVAGSGWCLPTYASLFTGHVPEVHGHYSNKPGRPLPDFETTLAEKLKQAGYDTAAFSGGTYFMKIWGLDRGFDTYVNKFVTSRAIPGTFAETMPGVMDWVKQRGDKPFFLFIAVDDLHVPYQALVPDMFDKGYKGLVNEERVRLVPFFRDYNLYRRGELPADATNYSRVADFVSANDENLGHLAARYDAALHTADRRVGDFLGFLKKQGLWEDSVVIVSADHGEQLGEHSLLGHTEGLYEPITHVPLVMHLPQAPHLKGKRLKQLVERIDMMPTILDLAGADYGSLQLQGKSLVPLFKDPSLELRRYAYASSKRNLPEIRDQLVEERVLRDERWKLHWYLYKDSMELYDLWNDPAETVNLADKEPAVLNRLAGELLKRVEVSRPHAPGLPETPPPAPESRPLDAQPLP